mmetsp:Transcript_46585/g.56387  ORF Transcript_46585/g.56387 Transcript_46585/m.56387 type:complete len:158 (+) Transcript_46585:125-598(+)
MDDCVNDCDYHFVDGDYGENQHEEAYWFVNNRYEDASYAGLSFDADVKTLKPAAIPSPTTDTVTMCVMCNMLADDKITTNADDQVHDNVMILHTNMPKINNATDFLAFVFDSNVVPCESVMIAAATTTSTITAGITADYTFPYSPPIFQVPPEPPPQ